MTMHPHPIVMSALAKHRASDLQTQAYRYRLAEQAERNGGARRRQPRTDGFAVLVVALALALLAASRAVAAEPFAQGHQAFVPGAAPVVAPPVAADDSTTNVVQKVREAAS